MKSNVFIISLLIALATGIIIYGFRIKRLYTNSKALLDTATQFTPEYRLGSPHNPALHIVGLGDSITLGQGVQRLEDTYLHQLAQSIADQNHYVHVQNFAASGARTEDVISKQLPQIASLNPRYIAITIGTNDATQFTNLSDYQKNISQILSQLTKKGSATILISNANDARTFPAFPPIYSHVISGQSKKQNGILARTAQQYGDRVRIIDLYGIGRLDPRVNPKYYANDLFHPDTLGYAKWARLFMRETTQ